MSEEEKTLERLPDFTKFAHIITILTIVASHVIMFLANRKHQNNLRTNEPGVLRKVNKMRYFKRKNM